MPQSDHQQAYGIEVTKEADRYGARLVLFSTILVISHLLDIRSAEIEAIGMKVKIPDAVIVYGGLALFVANYFYLWVVSSLVGGSLFRLDTSKPLLRGMTIASKRANRSAGPARIKRNVKVKYTAYVIFILPWIISLMVLVCVALVACVVDIYSFLMYLGENSEVVIEAKNLLA